MNREGAPDLGFQEASAVLDAHMRNRHFRDDMKTMLRPGLPQFDAMIGAQVVRAAYFVHLGS